MSFKIKKVKNYIFLQVVNGNFISISNDGLVEEITSSENQDAM